MTVRPFRSALAALAALFLATLALPGSAAAQYPCPSPGPNDQVVGEIDLGGGLGKGLMCVPKAQQPAGPAPAPRILNIYGSIAGHPDAGDVWMAGNSSTPGLVVYDFLAGSRR